MSPRSLLAACLGLTVVLLSVAFLINDRPVQQLVTSCFEEHCFDLESATELQPTLARFVAGTRFQEKINITVAPRAGHLNFYVAKGILPGKLAGLKCNCAYVGFDIVICDQAFLETFASSVNFTRDSIYGESASEIWDEEGNLFAKINQTTSATLLSWIIGHEIGHAVLHEPATAGRRIIMTREKENAADSFFLEKAEISSNANASQNISWALNQVIFQTISITYRDGKARIAPSSDGIHDPWIVRAIALGQKK